VEVAEEDVQETAKMGTQGHWGDGSRIDFEHTSCKRTAGRPTIGGVLHEADVNINSH